MEASATTSTGIATPEVERLRRSEQLHELKLMLSLATNRLAIPLYSLFWICDLVFAPHLKYTFLGYRAAIVVFNLLIHRLVARVTTLERLELVCTVYTTVSASVITAMSYQTGILTSPYYAGLNLVSIGTLLFFPLGRTHSAIALFGIYGLYFVLASVSATAAHDYGTLFVHSFFIFGTIAMSLVVRHFHERLRRQEILGRIKLEGEVQSRNDIIRTKTNEAIKLAALSAQFSPQVVHSIRSGSIDLESGVHRSSICVIFVDIVGSTERVTRIDKDDLNRVITMFMEDSVRVLLKYDITIDKFLGDGVLGFSNDPIQHQDYIQRVLRAALEIQNNIQMRQSDYIDNWKRAFEVRIGISVGFANVGFYGAKHTFRTYTAIGPAINLAHRLCSIAEPGQIIVSGDVVRKLPEQAEFKLSPLTERTIKGFEQDTLRIFALSQSRANPEQNSEVQECPQCKGVMYLDDSSGIFQFACRNCDANREPRVPLQKRAA